MQRLFWVLLVAFALIGSKPQESTLYTRRHGGSVLGPITGRVWASVRTIEFQDSKLWILAKERTSEKYFLGLLYTWIPLPSQFRVVWNAVAKAHGISQKVFIPGYRGIRINSELSLCFLPTSRGSACRQKIRGFVSLPGTFSQLMSLLSPKTTLLDRLVVFKNSIWKSFFPPWYDQYLNKIWVPLHYAYQKMEPWLETIAILDILFLGPIALFVLNSLLLCKECFKSLLTASKKNIFSFRAPAAIFLSPLFHPSGIETIAACLAIYAFGPPALMILGNLPFLLFYVCWCIFSAIVGSTLNETVQGSLGFGTALTLFLYAAAPKRADFNYILVGLQSLLMDPFGTLLGIGFGLFFFWAWWWTVE